MQSSEIEPLADVITSEKDEKVAVDMPRVKQDIKINAYGDLWRFPPEKMPREDTIS